MHIWTAAFGALHYNGKHQQHSFLLLTLGLPGGLVFTHFPRLNRPSGRSAWCENPHQLLAFMMVDALTSITRERELSGYIGRDLMGL